MVDLKLFGENEKQLETLVNTVRIFSGDICMEFGIKKMWHDNNEEGKVS